MIRSIIKVKQFIFPGNKLKKMNTFRFFIKNQLFKTFIFQALNYYILQVKFSYYKINSFHQMGNCVNLSLQKTLYHPYLGYLQKEYIENNTLQYFRTTSKVSSRQRYEKWLSEVRRLRYNPQTKNCLYLPQTIIYNEKDIFQRQAFLKVSYQPYIQTLEQFTLRCINNQQYPSEQLIWYLIYTLMKVGKYFQKIEAKIGNIIPSNIIISVNKQFRIVCQKSSLQFIKPIEEVNLNLSVKVLLAPEEIQSLKDSQENKCKQKVNPQISQVFTVGILALSLANLIQPHKLYYYDKKLQLQETIDFPQIQNLIHLMKRNKRFSDLLIQTIQQMIEIKPITRIKSSQLFQRLSLYEHEILSKKGLHYNLNQKEKSKEGLSSSLVTKNPNNSFLSGADRTIQHQTSFVVSQIGQTVEQNQSVQNDNKTYKLWQNRNTNLIHIL